MLQVGFHLLQGNNR